MGSEARAWPHMAGAEQELHRWSHPLLGLVQVCILFDGVHARSPGRLCGTCSTVSPPLTLPAILHGQALEPGPWDLDKRMMAQDDLSNMAQELTLTLDGDFHIQAYGSYRSGLLFPNSDLALALTGTSTREEDGLEVPLHELSKEEQNTLLKALAIKLEQQQLALGMVRCPLASFEC